MIERKRAVADNVDRHRRGVADGAFERAVARTGRAVARSGGGVARCRDSKIVSRVGRSRCRCAAAFKRNRNSGAFGERWWAKRWIAVLEGFGLGARLARGRSYARRGQVIEITVEPSGVRATVQGSREDPYVVTMRMTPLDARAVARRDGADFANAALFGDVAQRRDARRHRNGISRRPAASCFRSRSATSTRRARVRTRRIRANTSRRSITSSAKSSIAIRFCSSPCADYSAMRCSRRSRSKRPPHAHRPSPASQPAS